eukprot:CAMPEP_0168690954 /NCGR_PEP_ID=MMETSP0503-20121227/32433_1 /TAXON_ID=89963 /ORGANISM="Heterocapsa rotundata, Strain SCCAP K-0483" /LENGTH=43 /DNA_ID= /DNA_START= /DNA_END= /DNA_ORIENTATION=
MKRFPKVAKKVVPPEKEWPSLFLLPFSATQAKWTTKVAPCVYP